MTTIARSLHQGKIRVETTITKSNEHISTDAPAEYGGLGEMPTPVDILAGSLATCALTTYIMGAQKNGVNTDGFSVDVEDVQYNENHSQVTKFVLHFHLNAGVPPELRKRLEAFAHRGCTVGNTLTADKEFIFDYD